MREDEPQPIATVAPEVPARPDTGPFSALAVIAFGTVCIAMAMSLPAFVAFATGKWEFEWPAWVDASWGFGIPVGVASMVLLAIAQRRIAKARGKLRGHLLVTIGLVMAFIGFGLTLLIGMVEVGSNSM